MSRTVTGSIVTTEVSGNLAPSAALISSNELLSFYALTAQTNALLDTAIPQNYYIDSLYKGVSWRTTDGKAYIYAPFAAGTAASWALSTAGATQIDGAGASTQYHAMRYGCLYLAGIGLFFAPLHDGSGVCIYAFDKDMTPLGAYSPTFGPAFADTSSKVVRVEAVCPISTAQMIVAVGTHDFVLGLSTIQFWLVDSSTAILLDTIIQATLSDTYSSWYSCAKWASLICAIYDAANLSIRVIANAHPAGKSVTFSIKNSVESMLRPVVPVDPAYGSITYRAASIAQIGSLFYLCGRLSYAFADGSTQALDCYLTSSDGDGWSIGERSFYLHAADSMGAMLFDSTPNPDVIYYGGNLVVSSAVATPAQGANTATMQVAPVMQPGGSLSQVTNAANTLSFSVSNASGTYSDNPLFTNGSVLYLSKGQWGVLSQIGVFSIDTPAARINNQGRQPVSIRARDLGSKTIIRHNTPVDAEYNGQDALVTTLQDATGLIVKTRTADILNLDPTSPAAQDVTLYDATMGTSGLQHKGLNNPLVALADVQDAPDVFLKATITMPDTGDDHALTAFAFIFGAEDDGTFRAIIIPKANTWGSKTKPRVMISNIEHYDTAADTGGFNFPARMQALWSSNNVGDDAYLQAMTEAGGTYITETAYTHTAGTTRDYVLRLSGARVQLMWKPHDYAAGTMAVNAGFTTILEYVYGDGVRLTPATKGRAGFAVNTDTWALQTAFDHAAYADQEVTLSSATDYGSSGHYTTSAIPAGGTGYTKTNTANYTLYNGASVAAVDLRNYLYVGQYVFINGSVRIITAFAINSGNYNIIVLNSDAGSITNSPVYIRSGDYWGEAGSGSAVKTVGTGSIWLDPKPIKTIKTMSGKGAFITSDQTAYDEGWMDSDGVTHYRIDKGWDATWPGAYGEPGSWKFVFHHNSIGKFRASVDYGLAASGRMMIEHECVRYGEIQLTKWAETLANPGYAQTLWTTHIPTYYAIPQSQAAASTTIYNNAVHETDDISPDAISDAAGLLCEITGRSAGGAGSTVPNVYVTGNGGAGGGNRGYVTIDTLPAGPILNTDLLIVSGRGQLGTKKTTHASDAPVCLAPIPLSATTLPASYVTVSRFEAYTGVKRTIEDALKYLCNLAGVRAVAFRNLLTANYVKTPYVYTITATPAAIPIVASKTLTDFVLDMDVHIDTTNRLYIDFRNYYRLTLKQVGAAGAIEVGLQAPADTTITASGGFRWLQWATVNVNAGVTLCAAAADNAHVRVSVNDGNIAVEINGKHLMTFSLGEMIHTDGTSYKTLTPGAILLSYASAVSGNSASIRLIELWAEHKSISLPKDSNTSQAIRRLCDRWNIRSRATQDGGLGFSTYTSRDAGTTLQKSLQEHVHAGDDSHSIPVVSVTGKQSGMFIDRLHIVSDGWSNTGAQNSDVETVQAANEAAQVVSRESVEFATQETINCTSHIADECEDKVTLVYTGGGDAPSFASADFVITAINTTYDANMDTSRYDLRAYQAWE